MTSNIDKLLESERAVPKVSEALAQSVWEGVQAQLAAAMVTSSGTAAAAKTIASTPTVSTTLVASKLLIATLVATVLVTMRVWSPWTRDVLSVRSSTVDSALSQPLTDLQPLSTDRSGAHKDTNDQRGEPESAPLCPRVLVNREERSTGAPETTKTLKDAFIAKPIRGTKPEPTPAAKAATDPEMIADERDLIETARVQLQQGSYLEVIATTSRHALAFPSGQFAEERESTFIQALIGSGRTEEAINRAKAFEQQYPRSIFLAAVREAVRNEP